MSCQDNQIESTNGFQLLSENETGINFTNTVQNTESFNIFSYRNFYNGGGVAIGDINNDGLEDIYFTSNKAANHLYLNKGNLNFENITLEAGVDASQQWSTGATFVDINQDGWKDLYVCNAGIPKDGDQRNYLYINNGDNTFTEKANAYGLDDSGYTTHAAFFDYDLDGDLDAYILNNSFIPVNTLNFSNKRELRSDQWDVKDFLKGGGDKLLRNDNGVYTDVTSEAGIYSSLIGFGLGITVGDVNNDRYPDLYISNDFYEKDYLYINNQKGGFTESIEDYMAHISHSSMGADMADINNDGFMEIFVTDMLPRDEYRLKTTTSFDNINLKELKTKRGFYNQYMHNTLQLNNKGNGFQEISYSADVAASDWSWGALMFDANNNGYQDIYVCNGIYHDVIDQDFIDFFSDKIIQEMVLTGEKKDLNEVINQMPSTPIPNHLFINQKNLTFEDQANQYGLAEPSFSNGSSYADLDKDGDLDLIVNNLNQASQVFENKTTKHNFISFQLKGDSQNKEAIGTRVELYADTVIQVRELMPSRGFQSSSSFYLHFGLGEISNIDSIVCIWPDQTKSIHDDLTVNQYHTIDKPNQAKQHQTIATKSFFKSANNDDFVKHEENEYLDFLIEQNIPMMLSQEGPKADQADVDADGDLDLYIAGGANQAGQLYLWDDDHYELSNNTAFNDFTTYEETAVHFFDADGDKDPDLFIGSGGNDKPIGSRYLQHRLFLNDGKGNFKQSNYAFPPNGVNTAVAASHDYDGDGDLDLFVGGRSANANYGLPGISFLYLNNGEGRFSELAKSDFNNLYRVGMVTDATWANIDGKGSDELIVIGEWMAPKIFSYTGTSFEEIPHNLTQLSGFWYSLAVEDLNKDGHLDIVLGNIGTNSSFTNRNEELSLWINDFNNNENIEKILTKSVDGKDVPIFTKRDIINQLPEIKKENLLHRDFADKSIQQLLDPEKLNRSLRNKANYFKSIIAYGKGAGQFDIVELPQQTQFSSVNAIEIVDVNKDDDFDLFIGGNKYDLLPQFSRLDASSGQYIQHPGSDQQIGPSSEVKNLGIDGEIQDFIFNENGGLTVLINNKQPIRIQKHE